MTKKVGIVGGGYVGKAMAEFFRQKGHYEVWVYDKDSSLCQNMEPNLDEQKKRDLINQCDLAVVCVPTPTRDDGGCDVSIVWEVVDWLTTELILVKSTVAIGTTDNLRVLTGKRVVFSPEYCGEGKYYAGHDFQNSVIHEPFYTFGGKKADTSAMVDIFIKIAGPCKRYIQTSALDAEVAKYMENMFIMTKVVFCYEMFEICKRVGADYNSVREAWLADPRMGEHFTAIFDNNTTPCDSKCIPKDPLALEKTSIDLGYSCDLISEVIDSNRRIGELRRNG